MRFPPTFSKISPAVSPPTSESWKAPYANLRGMEIDAALVESAVSDLMPRPAKIEPQDIIQAVVDAFDVTEEELRSRSRSHRIALPRQVVMYLLRENSTLSYPDIGERLGNRDHTTVMYGNKKIAELMDTDRELRRRVNHIQEELFTPTNVAY